MHWYRLHSKWKLFFFIYYCLRCCSFKTPEALFCTISRTLCTITLVITCVAALQVYFSQAFAQCQTKVMRWCNGVMKHLSFFHSHLNLTFQVVTKLPFELCCVCWLVFLQRVKLNFGLCCNYKFFLKYTWSYFSVDIKRIARNKCEQPFKKMPLELHQC